MSNLRDFKMNPEKASRYVEAMREGDYKTQRKIREEIHKKEARKR